MNPNASLTLDGVHQLQKRRREEADRPFRELAEAVLDGALTDPAEVLERIEALKWSLDDLRNRCRSIATKRVEEGHRPKSETNDDTRAKKAQRCAEDFLDGVYASDLGRMSPVAALEVQLSRHNVTSGEFARAMESVKQHRLLELAQPVAGGAAVPADLDAKLGKLDRTREQFDLEVRRIKQDREIAAPVKPPAPSDGKPAKRTTVPA